MQLQRSLLASVADRLVGLVNERAHAEALHALSLAELRTLEQLLERDPAGLPDTPGEAAAVAHWRSLVIAFGGDPDRPPFEEE